MWVWTRKTGIAGDYGAFRVAGTPVATVAPCCHTINDRGEIVGFSVEPDNPYVSRALVWQGKEPKELYEFVSDPGPFVYLTGAFSINDAGEIACQGVTTTGEFHACLAVPSNGVSTSVRRPVSPAPLPEHTRELLRRRFGIRTR